MIPQCGYPYNPELTGMNEKGIEAWNKWERIYREELERLQKELNDPEYTEGWCIIDSYEFVKTLQDEAELCVWAYGEGVDAYINDWVGCDDERFFRDADGNWYSLHELEKEIGQHFYDYQMITEG